MCSMMYSKVNGKGETIVCVMCACVCVCVYVCVPLANTSFPLSLVICIHQPLSMQRFQDRKPKVNTVIYP